MIENEDYKIQDNFLPKEQFLKIKNLLMGRDIAWYFNDYVSGENSNDSIYFTHIFYNKTIMSDYYKILNPILDILNPKALIRIKGNLYPKTNEIFNHGKHKDYYYEHSAFIYYINTNNGCTVLDDKVKIESVENRGLFFNGAIEHNSTTCTDKDVRVNINFNYFV